MSESKLTYSVAETARVLGVSRPTVYRLIDRPDFPSVRVGSRVLIPCGLLEVWLEERAVRKEDPHASF